MHLSIDDDVPGGIAGNDDSRSAADDDGRPMVTGSITVVSLVELAFYSLGRGLAAGAAAVFPTKRRPAARLRIERTGPRRLKS